MGSNFSVNFRYKRSEYRFTRLSFSNRTMMGLYRRVGPLAVQPVSAKDPIFKAAMMWLESPYRDTIFLQDFINKIKP